MNFPLAAAHYKVFRGALKRNLLLVIAVALLSTSCAQSSDIFGDIGTNLASPTSMFVDSAGNRLYLVNSNSRVLYDSTEGSLQVYDITNPVSPSLIKTTSTLSFSGQIYVDIATNNAFLPNRYTSSDSATQGVFYKFNTDGTSSGFLSFTESAIAKDAFAIRCCYPAGRAWVTTGMNELQYVDLAGDLTPGSISLNTTLDNGGVLTNTNADSIAIVGNQAFLSREWGGIMVVNLDEAGVAGAVPMDYFIDDIEAPQGLATDGALLYVAGQGTVGDTWTQYLLIINPSSLTPLADNATTVAIDMNDSGILQTTIEVGNNPQNVLLATNATTGVKYAFVTNQNDDTVSAVNLTTNVVDATIAVGDEPFAMGLYTTVPGAVDQYVYVGNAASNTISIIDIPTLAVVATYP